MKHHSHAHPAVLWERCFGFGGQQELSFHERNKMCFDDAKNKLPVNLIPWCLPIWKLTSSHYSQARLATNHLLLDKYSQVNPSLINHNSNTHLSITIKHLLAHPVHATICLRQVTHPWRCQVMTQNCVLWAQYSWIMPVCCQGPLLDLLDIWDDIGSLIFYIIGTLLWKIPATMRNVGTTPTTTTSNNTSISSLSWLFFRTAKIRKSLNLILCHQFGPCFLDCTCPWTSMTIHGQKALAKAGRKASGYGDITGCETPCRSLSKAMEWCL